mmetsp:Transcript_53784/g.85598  ORF Transcript_53784/g.85598 Transcript_53784/m.85598 type:complete len:200 (-) Transcript_53784:1990-2589(-)
MFFPSVMTEALTTFRNFFTIPMNLSFVKWPALSESKKLNSLLKLSSSNSRAASPSLVGSLFLEKNFKNADSSIVSLLPANSVNISSLVKSFWPWWWLITSKASFRSLSSSCAFFLAASARSLLLTPETFVILPSNGFDEDSSFLTSAMRNTFNSASTSLFNAIMASLAVLTLALASVRRDSTLSASELKLVDDLSLSSF